MYYVTVQSLDSGQRYLLENYISFVKLFNKILYTPQHYISRLIGWQAYRGDQIDRIHDILY